MAEARAGYQSRIVGTGEEAPDQLLANEKNWRIHPQFQQEAVGAVLEEVGWVTSVIVNQRTGRLVDGHLRVTLAMRRGEKAIPVTYVDLSEEEESLILATLDPLAGLAGTDRVKLSELLEGIEVSDSSLNKLLDSLAPGASGAFDLGAYADEDDSLGPTTLDLPASHVRMVQLFLNTDTLEPFLAAADVLQAKYGTDNLTDTVYEAVKRAAQTERMPNPWKYGDPA